MDNKTQIRHQLVKGVDLHRLAATIIKDCQEKYVMWGYAAIHRMREMTGQPITYCQAIVFEMSDMKSN